METGHAVAAGGVNLYKHVFPKSPSENKSTQSLRFLVLSEASQFLFALSGDRFVKLVTSDQTVRVTVNGIEQLPDWVGRL